MFVTADFSFRLPLTQLSFSLKTFTLATNRRNAFHRLLTD
jgi:hypothetical protein